MRVLGILGSLRSASYNAQVFASLPGRFGPDVEFVRAPRLDSLPLYNEDLIVDAAPPASVKEFRAAVDGADALMWVTPEYNHSLPGVVKNAIDWLPHPLAKPSAVLVVTPGRGGLRCMTEMTRILREMGGVVAPGYPEPCLQYAADQIIADGTAIDFANPGIQALLDGMCESLERLAATGVAQLCGELFVETQARWWAAQRPPRWDTGDRSLGAPA